MMRKFSLMVVLGGYLATSVIACSDDTNTKLDKGIPKDSGAQADNGLQPDQGVNTDQGGQADQIIKWDKGGTTNDKGSIKYDQGGAKYDKSGPYVDQGAQPDSGGVKPVKVTGFVENDDTRKKITGATVSVVGASPPNSTTTDSWGSFTLQIKPGSTVFLKAEFSGLVSTILPLVTSATSNPSMEFYLLSAATLDLDYKDAGMPKRDSAKGIVEVQFNNKSSAGGEGASLSVSHGGSFAFNASGDAVKSSKLLPSGEDSLTFVNVATGQTSVNLSASKCKLTYASIKKYPVQANTLTDIATVCTP